MASSIATAGKDSGNGRGSAGPGDELCSVCGGSRGGGVAAAAVALSDVSVEPLLAAGVVAVVDVAVDVDVASVVEDDDDELTVAALPAASVSKAITARSSSVISRSSRASMRLSSSSSRFSRRFRYSMSS